MTITVYPYKLTQRELEARLAPGLTVLPGQLLRFEGKSPVYGQIQEVCALPPASAGMPEGYGVRIRLLHGCPTLEPQQVSLLNASQMAREVQRLQEPFRQPLQLGKVLTAELSNLGALSLVEGDDFVLKYEALLLFLDAVRSYGQVLILDPLGLFTEDDDLTYWQAGRDVRLSVQAVGSKRFLSAFGDLFSPGLRDEALRVVAEHLPPLAEFTGFNHLLNLETTVNVPLRNLILQNYHAVAHAHVFADAPEQVFDLSGLAERGLGVVDLSGLEAPWKSLFYEQLALELLKSANSAKRPVLPVFIYPENYLQDLPAWVQKADEAEASLLVVASPYAVPVLQEMANNRVRVESRQHVEIQGALTLGLPVSFSLAEGNVLEPAAPDVDPDFSVTAHAEEFLTVVDRVAVDAMVSEPERAIESPEALSPAPRKPQEQAWWFEVSQPVVEEDEETPEQAETDALLTESESLEVDEQPLTAEQQSSEEKMPRVVDLSAPMPEPTISFLTAEQLSALLSSSESDADADTEVEQAPRPPEDALDYADAEEGAWSVGGETDANHLLPPDLDAPSPAKKPETVLPEAIPEEEALSGAKNAQPPEKLPLATDEAIEESSAPPPFPTPEDEFSFDLHMDDSAEATNEEEGSYSSYLGGGESLPDTVSRSLSEFEDMDLPAAEEPLFDFEPELYSVTESADALPAVDQEAPSSLANYPPTRMDTDTPDDMKEALDSIFPQSFMEDAPDTEPTLLEVDESAPMAKAPVAPVDEDIPVIQKPVEPMPGNEAGFQIGERVRHPAYGAGVVQRIIPMEESVVLNISFDSVGKRLLDPALCDLVREPVA